MTYMGGVQNYILSARFILTIGHLIALLLVLSTLQTNIEASFPDDASTAEKDKATESCKVSIAILQQHKILPLFMPIYAYSIYDLYAALALGIICFFIDFSGLFFGTSIFSNIVSDAILFSYSRCPLFASI